MLALVLGIDLICLPECSIFMGETALETCLVSESILDSTELNSDSYSAKLCQLASEHKIWISVGGFPEVTSQDVIIDNDASNSKNIRKISNTHFLINREGIIQRPYYRKIHLFDCPLVNLQESRLTEAGTELVVIQVEGWNIGLSVCYDLRFPLFYEALGRLALKTLPPIEGEESQGTGLDMILVPAAFTVPTGSAHWEILLRARAIENQCYVLAPAQSGKHNEKRYSYGHTMIIDPWGKLYPS